MQPYKPSNQKSVRNLARADLAFSYLDHRAQQVLTLPSHGFRHLQFAITRYFVVKARTVSVRCRHDRPSPGFQPLLLDASSLFPAKAVTEFGCLAGFQHLMS